MNKLYSALFSLIIVAATLLLTPAHAAKRAFIVGNEHYTLEGVKLEIYRIPTASTDAKDMAKVMGDLGFIVSADYDLSHQKFKTMLKNFIDSVQKDDEVFIYFSGHGIATKTIGNMLAPIDAPVFSHEEEEDTLRDHYIVVDTELRALAKRAPRIVVTVVDACRSYPVRQAGKKSLGTTAGLNTGSAPALGQMFMYAAIQGTVATYRKTDRNSLYTSVLLKELKQPHKNLEELAKNVNDGVITLAKSRGVEQQPESRSNVYGHYSFSPLPAPAAVQPAPTIAPSSSAADKAEIERLRQALAQQAKPEAAATQSRLDGFDILDDPTLGKASLARDPITGLVWQRCSVGQSWTGSSCAGEAKTFTFEQALQLTRNGWRVPTVRELHSIVVCSSGQTMGTRDLDDGGANIKNWCIGKYTSPTINTSIFPETSKGGFWSSSPYKDYQNSWAVIFHDGSVSFPLNFANAYARLVRASP